MNITGGKYNSRKVKAPETDSVRPTLSKIRAGIFNSLGTYIDFENSSFLDLFSGSGIMSLEAISRGFKTVLSIEKDFKTAKIIKENFNTLNLKPNLIIKDATKILDTIKEKYDVIYIDPPYKNIELYNKSIQKIAENEALTPNGILIIESQKGIEYDIPSGFSLIKEKIYGDTIIRFYK